MFRLDFPLGPNPKSHQLRTRDSHTPSRQFNVVTPIFGRPSVPWLWIESKCSCLFIVLLAVVVDVHSILVVAARAFLVVLCRLEQMFDEETEGVQVSHCLQDITQDTEGIVEVSKSFPVQQHDVTMIRRKSGAEEEESSSKPSAATSSTSPLSVGVILVVSLFDNQQWTQSLFIYLFGEERQTLKAQLRTLPVLILYTVEWANQ